MLVCEAKLGFFPIFLSYVTVYRQTPGELFFLFFKYIRCNHCWILGSGMSSLPKVFRQRGRGKKKSITVAFMAWSSSSVCNRVEKKYPLHLSHSHCETFSFHTKYLNFPGPISLLVFASRRTMPRPFIPPEKIAENLITLCSLADVMTVLCCFLLDDSFDTYLILCSLHFPSGESWDGTPPHH